MRSDLVEKPTIGAQGGTIGRPRKEPPQDAALRIQKAAAEGASIVGIATQFRVGKDTFRAWLNTHPELMEAFEVGRERERQELHELIKRDARDGEKPNVNAMFLLKTRHGYREGDPAETGGPRLSVTFNLPGAMSREDFMKTVVSDERGQ